MSIPAPRRSPLTTYAPEVEDRAQRVPAGNLWISLDEVDGSDGSVHSLGALIERSLGLVEAAGSWPSGSAGHASVADGQPATDALIRPRLEIDGQPVTLGGPTALHWRRASSWLPVFTCPGPTGVLEGRICAPVDEYGGERGVALRLEYRNSGTEPTRVGLGWSGRWSATTVTHLRSKPIDGVPVGGDDAWTGTRTVTLQSGLPLLSIGWQGGDGVHLTSDGVAPIWNAWAHRDVGAGEAFAVELFVGVATEPDGAATTALHLRRRGFEDLWSTSVEWLDRRALPVADGGRHGLAERVNSNLFFNYFYAQGDCLDTGRPVLVTSRSRRYYVAAAFWSRDAYCWTFPALLLTDPERARRVLVASLATAGTRASDHALYLNGTSLYPGFELDQAAAPILAVWRYVRHTGDASVLSEPDVRTVLDGLVALVEPWRHPSWALYGTFLLPTDDPTDFPYVTTANALWAAACDARAWLLEATASSGPAGGPAPDEVRAQASGLRTRAAAIRAALVEHLVVAGPDGPMWAWACDSEGAPEFRDEPPLGLRTLPYWGVGDLDDPVQAATRRWLVEGSPYHYSGPYPGAGAAHFPHPSGFDLANRLLDRDPVEGDPLTQLAGLPLDHGLACESWDVDSGEVRTGAAMASMAGLLAWTAWEHLSGRTRWDQPPDPS